MSINLDFSSVPSREPLEEGVYSFQIKKVEEKVSQTGKNMLLVLFEEVETKTGVFENYVLCENCLWKLQELLNALGVETDGAVAFDPQSIVGEFIKGKVIQEEYNDSMVNRMKKVFAA